jgi:hypothetical protein
MPTLKELRANNAEMYTWVGLLPKKTPAPVVERAAAHGEGRVTGILWGIIAGGRSGHG